MTAPHLGPGHSIAGKYTVRALLGFTGEVATYQAVSSDGREVVIKMFDPSVGQRADVMAQLDRVRHQIAQLPPGAVVAAFDAGYDQGTGAPFSATEYLQIPSLGKLVETGPLSPDVVAQVMRGVGTLLDAAHAIGLHHLALKPTNIFVGPAPTYAVRITDFEASVIRRTSPATHEVYSQSAPWWAPEQLQPAAVLGPPADVFAAALVAFCALAGRSYWLSCQTHPPDLPNWQLELMGQRVPVSQRARDVGAVINPLFDGVFARALSVNQADRPQSAMEVTQVLAAATSSSADQSPKTLAFPEGGFPGGDPRAPYLAGADQGGYVATGSGAPSAPVEASGLPPFPQPVKKKSASPMLPIIIGVTAAVLLGGGGMMFLFMRTPSSNATAPLPTTTASVSSDGPAGTGETKPEPTPEPAPAPEPSAAPKEETVAVSIRCTPACDRIELDGKTVDKPQDKLALAPGKYKIALIKQGYLIHRDTIDVVADKPIDKEVALIKIGPVKPAPSKGCGQFLCP